MLTKEERKEMMEANPPVVYCLHTADVYFDWGWKGCGFGQFSFEYNRETGEITAMNECMGRESIRKFLHALADYIADRVVLLDNPEDIPPKDSKAEFQQAKAEQEEWERQHEQK